LGGKLVIKSFSPQRSAVFDPIEMRYFFEISYNGSAYAGWQTQRNAVGVQAVVEEALATLLREPVKIVGSGRTDTGVHCEQQFFHTDISVPFEPGGLIGKLNSFLPGAISIQRILKVKEEAHARYDATERTYEYRITTRKNPFMEGLALHYHKPLNLQTMNRAASLLVGVHDFTSFSKVKTDVNHFLCDVRSATWKQDGSTIIFTIKANRFLRGMVRALVGTLLDVGTGKLTMEEFKKIVSAKDRRKAGMNVDPQGLFLVNVKYHGSIFLKH
jgi:tRNA pseudouridine38-40 synthase